jgi:hypothetical protein
MASGDKAAERSAQSLLVRLQRHLDTLSEVQTSGETVRLQRAIDELRKDIEDLEILAPHVFVLPKPR